MRNIKRTYKNNTNNINRTQKKIEKTHKQMNSERTSTNSKLKPRILFLKRNILNK
jgi:hypothetical protein